MYEPQTNAVINRFDLNAPTLNARWKNAATGLRTYSSTFKATTYSTKGGALVFPQGAIPVCEGYTFKGWFKAKTGSDSAPAMTTDAGSTYYAQWVNNLETCYLVTLNSNVPGNEEVESGYIHAGQPLTLNGDVYKRVGYSLTGWATSKNAPASYGAFANITGTAGQTICLYAQWTLDKYTIDYVLDGGSWESGVTAPVSFDYAANADVVAVPNPVRTGYVFVGWTGTGLDEATVGLTIDPSSNDKLGGHEAGTNLYVRTYTATWAPVSYKMTFDLAFEGASWKEGEAPAEGAYDAIVYDTAVTFPKMPVRSGWVFIGWVPVEAEAEKGSYAAEETVDPANFASEQDAIASFEAHWARNLKATVPIGQGTAELSLTADWDADEFTIEEGTSNLVNLTDAAIEVVSIEEDVTDASALEARKENAREAFSARVTDPAALDAMLQGARLLVQPVREGTKTGELASFPLFGSYALKDGDWTIPASSDPVNGTDESTLELSFGMDIDRDRISTLDLKIDLEHKTISSLVYTIALVDKTEPVYSAGA